MEVEGREGVSLFCQTGIFAGFSLHIINLAVWISEAAMGGAGDIILIKKE